MTSIDVARSLANLSVERDAIALYDELARIDPDPRRADSFRAIAASERRHAEVWGSRLRELGATIPPAHRPRPRVRLIMLLARLLGTHAVAGLVLALEGNESALYGAQLSPETLPHVTSIAADERANAETWRALAQRRRTATAVATLEAARRKGDGHGVATDVPATAAGTAPATAAGTAGAAGAALPAEPGQSEPWHRASRGGTLRAVIFGVSDGLVSNLSLVMGVAGASANDPKFILLAGIAGLLAGAFSMAAGEYISVQSQRELFEHQISLERAELEMMPELEEAELAAIYRSKGFTEDEARSVARRLASDPEMALDTLVREELGLDPKELGSAWKASGGSFVAFSIGAILPVIPFLFGGGILVFAVAIGISLVALFAVGAAVSLVTGRSLLFSGVRQVGIGALAAGVTYAVGLVIGVSVG